MQSRKSADKNTQPASQDSTDLIAQSIAFLAVLWALLWRLLRVMNLVSAPKQLTYLPKTKLDTDSPRTPPKIIRKMHAAKTSDIAPDRARQVGAVLPSFSLLKYPAAVKITKEAQLRALLAQTDDSKKKSPCTNK